MKKVGKRVCSWLMAMTMGLGVVYVQAPMVVKAADTPYEYMPIKKDDLNKNVIWGKTEAYDGEADNKDGNIGLDKHGMFYTENIEYTGIRKNTQGGFPENGIITMRSGVDYQLSWEGKEVYDENDGVCVNKLNTKRSIHFDTIDSFSAVHILATAGNANDITAANVTFTIHYTDGTYVEREGYIYDWFKEPKGDVEKYPDVIRIRKNNGDNLYYDGTIDKEPYLQSLTIESDSNKLIQFIDFEYTAVQGSDTFNCCVFALTGEKARSVIAELTVPVAEPATDIQADSFVANWKPVKNASGYVIDVSTTEDFTEILNEYNNKPVDGTSVKVSGLKEGITYYYRVRAVNKDGQTKNSNTIDTLIPTIAANDFIISVKDAAKVKEDDVKKNSAANGKSTDGKVLDYKNKNLDANDEAVDEIKNAKSGDTVDVKISNKVISNEVEGGYEPATEVKAHVVDEVASKTERDKKYEIGANEIVVSTKTAETFVKANENKDHAKVLSSLAGVVAVAEGKTVENPLITVEYDNNKPLKAEKGDYDVTYVYTYADGKTVKVTSKVIVKDSSFDVIPSNPKSDDDAKDGIDGANKDDDKSKDNDYVYRIHLASDVDSVNLNPVTDNVEITGLTKDGKDAPVPEDGVCEVTGVTSDKEVVVVYTVKSTLDNTESTYTYIIDREKEPVIKTDIEDQTPDDPADNPQISDPAGPKEEDVDDDGVNEQVKDITITVPSTQKKVEVKVTPENNTIIDNAYGKDGLNEIVKPDGVKITNDLKDKSSFTVNNLSTDEDTVVSVKALSEDERSSVIYRYTIVNEKSDDATIKDVTPRQGTTDDEKIVEITTDDTEYTWPIVLNDPKATVESIEKVSGTGKVTNPEDKSSFKVEGLDPEDPVVVKVVTKAENGDTLTYLVKITNVPEEVKEPDKDVNIETTVNPLPDAPENKPVVDDTKEPEKVEDDEDELVKKITITVPSVQDTVTVNVTPKEGRLDLQYDEDGLKEIDKPEAVTITNNLSNEANPSFTVNKLSTDKDTVVSIKGISDDDKKVVIYEYTIKREKSADATIKDVTPKPGTTDDEKIVEITTDDTEYTWPIELNDPKATVKTIEKVSGTGKVTNPEDKSSFKVEGLDPENPVIVKVVTQAENGDTLTYFVKINNTQLENVNNPVLSETPVQDSTPKGTSVVPATTVQPVDIVYEKTNPEDKTEPIDPAKKVANTGALKVNGTPVDKYTVSQDGKSLIINKDYIETLPKDTYQAVITYTDGTEQKFSITVVDYNEATIVKNPPLFSMYKEIVLKKKNTFTVNLSGITDYAVVKADITGKGKNAKKVVSIKQKANGDVVITPKKVGKSQVTCTIIQNGAEYKVVVDLKVLKQYKGTSKNYNLKNAGLVKTDGELPEFNVYKRIVKGKNTKIKFTKVEKDANVKFYVTNKKEAKSLKIGKVKRSGNTVTCTIKGKKKGWVHLTAEITQNGKTYYTRLLVRIDDGTWTSKQLKKYLK